MPLVSDKPLEELVDEDFVERSARVVVDRVVGERGREERPASLLERAIEKTPEAEIPEAYRGDRSAWIRDRGHRKPGSLRDDWTRTPVEEAGDIVRASITNDDPIYEFVENDTAPHAIRARRATYLRFPSGARFIYRREVWHPGTEGQHMARDAAAEIVLEGERIAARVLDEQAALENRRP